MFSFTGQSVPASATVTLNPPAGTTWVMAQPFNSSSDYRYSFEEVLFEESQYALVEAKLRGVALGNTSAVRMRNYSAWAAWMAVYYYALANPADDIQSLGLWTASSTDYDFRPAAGVSWLLTGVRFQNTNYIQELFFREGANWYYLSKPHPSLHGLNHPVRLPLTNDRYLRIRGQESSSCVTLTYQINPTGLTPLWLVTPVAGYATVRVSPAAGKVWLIGARATVYSVRFWLYRVSGLQRLHNDMQYISQWWHTRFWVPDTVGLELYNDGSTAGSNLLVGLIEDNT